MKQYRNEWEIHCGCGVRTGFDQRTRLTFSPGSFHTMDALPEGRCK